MESEIYFRQLNCQHGIIATADIQTNVNQAHLLTEPYFSSSGAIGVDNKNKCFYDITAVNTEADPPTYPRAAVYTPNVKDAILMPVSDLMSRDMATVMLENKAAEKPLLIVSMYFDNSRDKNGRERDPKHAITPDLIRVTGVLLKPPHTPTHPHTPPHTPTHTKKHHHTHPQTCLHEVLMQCDAI